jgi:hypothetical protein
MPRNEIRETPEGTIRCPTSTPGSMLELSVSGASVLRRYLNEKGQPHGDHKGQWVVISAADISAYYGWPELREWLRKNGFNDALIREREEVERQAKRAWKKNLRR